MDASAPPTPARPFTAWHVFLVEILRTLGDSRRVAIHDFDKLGTLPLEADVILLLLEDVADRGRIFGDDLAWLDQRLRRLTVIEYKSPRAVLTRAHFDTTVAYAMLGKRKYDVTQDSDVAVLLLYSTVHGDLFDSLERDGRRFEPEEPGIRCCRSPGLLFYAVNLSLFSGAHPHNTLALLSSRHRSFRADPAASPASMALFNRLRYLIQQRKVHGMDTNELEGFQELSDDLATMRKQLFAELDPNERLEWLAGLQPSERLAGLQPSERLAGLQPSERLAGLQPSERLAGLQPSERLVGLDPAQREELLALLLGKNR